MVCSKAVELRPFPKIPRTGWSRLRLLRQRASTASVVISVANAGTVEIRQVFDRPAGADVDRIMNDLAAPFLPGRVLASELFHSDRKRERRSAFALFCCSILSLRKPVKGCGLLALALSR